MKKFLLLVIGSHLLTGLLWGDVSQGSLTQTVQNIIPQLQTDATANMDYGQIARTIQFWIFSFVGVIATIFIVWTGAKLIWAKGNTEEMTSALKSLAYVMLGLAVIPLAYIIVKFIINLRI